MTPTDKNDAPRGLRKPWHRIWPLAAIGVALLVNAAWIGLLGYALAKLLAGDAGPNSSTERPKYDTLGRIAGDGERVSQIFGIGLYLKGYTSQYSRGLGD